MMTSTPTTAPVRDVPVSAIIVERRFRKDMGDLSGLAASIARLGLLQPIGVTEDNRLIFGERRLRAVRDVLKWKTIPARVVRLDSILVGEYHENEVRKDFTPTERLAIGAAVEIELGNRQGQRTDLPGSERLPDHGPEVHRGVETRDVAAKAAGFGSGKNYERAKRVVRDGTPELADAMDRGEVSIRAAADISALPKQEQVAALAAGPVEVKRAAKAARERKAPRASAQDALAAAEARRSSATSPVLAPEPEPTTAEPEPEPLDERTAALIAKARALVPPARPQYDDGWFTIRINCTDPARDRWNVRAYYAGTGPTAETTRTGRDKAAALAAAIWRSYLSRDGWPEPAPDAPAAHRNPGGGLRWRE